MITSGSWRSSARSAEAKVKPAFGFTCAWCTPSRFDSTGSSTVLTLIEVRSKVCSALYSVVLLPEPVGPVTSAMP